MHEEYWKHLETEQDYSWVNISGLLVALVPIFRSPIRASRRPPQEHLHLGILSEITWRPLQSFTVFWCFYGCDLTVVEDIWSRAFGTIKHSYKASPSLCSNNTCKTSCPILTPYPSCTIRPCIHSKWSMVRGTLVDKLCFLACDFSHPTMRVFFIVPHWSSIRSLWLLLLCSAACIAWFPESSSNISNPTQKPRALRCNSSWTKNSLYINVYYSLLFCIVAHHRSLRPSVVIQHHSTLFAPALLPCTLRAASFWQMACVETMLNMFKCRVLIQLHPAACTGVDALSPWQPHRLRLSQVCLATAGDQGTQPSKTNSSEI